MRRNLFITCLLISSVLHAQTMHLFGDSLQKLYPSQMSLIIHKGIYSYINTLVTTNSKTLYMVVKVDTSGRTIWTSPPENYLDVGSTLSALQYNDLIAGSNEDLYVLMQDVDKIGKMRTSNGSIDWLVPTGANLGDGRLVDYDAQTLLFANTAMNSNMVRLNRFSKSKGQDQGYVDLRCPGGTFFGICIAPNGNIFLSSADSCYKYTSLSNPVLEWRVRNNLGTTTSRFSWISKMVLEGDNLIIFGSKSGTFRNGTISCINVTNGTLRWSEVNSGLYDLGYNDHVIKNGKLYTTWGHIYVGGISEMCYINKIDITTGTKAWEFNHNVQINSPVYTKQQAMKSMVIDDNETIFLAGYGNQEAQSETSLSFLKLRGSDGSIIKKSFQTASGQGTGYPMGITIRLFNGKLYTTGRMFDNVAGLRLDTATITPEKINIYSAAIQFPSTVFGMKTISRDKKILVKRIGKKLMIEMVDPGLNSIWSKNIGDTASRYEGFQDMGISDSATTVTVPIRKYRAENSPYYFSAVNTPDSFELRRFDSIGNNTHTLKNFTTYSSRPYQFLQDSLRRLVSVIAYGTPEPSFLEPLVFPNTVARPTLTGGSSGDVGIRPYPLLRPSVYFAYSSDTMLYFGQPSSRDPIGGLKKTWGTHGYSAAHRRVWSFDTLRIRWFNSVERETKDLYYIAARDSSSNDLLFKYRVSDSTILWIKTQPSAYVTIKGYELNGAFYALRQNGDDYLIQKYDGATGNTIWSNTIMPPAGHTFNLKDFAISKQRYNITLVGNIEDTLIRNQTKVFIATYDTSGNTILNMTKDGYKSWQNTATSITIAQDGQSLVAGQISDSTYGYAGFIYEVDASSLTAEKPIISGVTASTCATTIPQKSKLLNPVTEPNDISIIMDDAIPLSFNRADSTFTYSIVNTGHHSIRVTYNYVGFTTSRDTSFEVKPIPPNGAAPTLTGNLLTAPAIGTTYQWYRNGSIIGGAISQTLTITQEGTYAYTYGIDNCMSALSASLTATLTAIIDPTNNNAVITIYPNPSSGNLTLRNLSSTQEYGIQMIDKNGKLVYELLPIPRGNSYTLHLEKLSSGNYILKLWSLSKKIQLGFQQIIILK